MSKYLIIIQTQCLKTPDSDIRRMVKDCFVEETQLRFSKLSQVLADTTPLPLFEILVDSSEPPFGILPKYVKRLARA